MGLLKLSVLQEVPKQYWTSDEGWQFCLYMAVAFPQHVDHWNNMAALKLKETDYSIKRRRN